MFIQTQPTPNPQTMKFIPGVTVLTSGTLSFAQGDEVKHEPLVKALFEIPGVVGIFLAEEFVTITKQPNMDWTVLKPMVLTVLLDHFASGRPAVLAHASNTVSTTGVEDEIVQQIKAIIEEQVRPAVAQDGGDIVFHKFVDGVVYLELHGSCSGCPSSTITLKNGIENMLRHYIPEVQSVEAI